MDTIVVCKAPGERTVMVTQKFLRHETSTVSGQQPVETIPKVVDRVASGPTLIVQLLFGLVDLLRYSLDIFVR